MKVDNTEEERPTKKRRDDDDDDDAIGKTTTGGSGGYRRLKVYGEHKRAVSSVRFAPSNVCKNKSTESSYGLVASASASAFVKVWDLKTEYVEDLGDDDEDDEEEEHEEKEKKPDATARGTKEVDDSAGTATSTDAGAAASGDDQQSQQQQQHHTSSSSPSGRKALTHSALCVGHTRGINDLAWNPVSPLLASASDDKTVRLWDVDTGESLVEFRGHENYVFCVDQHHAMVVSGSFDETVKLWDIRSGDCVSTLPAHSDPVTAVSFNRDGTCVCSGSHDGLIRVWDVATGECLKTIFAAGNPPVSSVTYSPNGKYLLAGTLDSTLRLWPVHRTGSHKCAKTYKSPKYHVNTKYSVASDFLYDGNVVTGSETGNVVVYDVQRRTVLQALSGHDDAVLAVSGHDSLPLLASGGMMADRKVEFWVDKAKL